MICPSYLYKRALLRPDLSLDSAFMRGDSRALFVIVIIILYLTRFPSGVMMFMTACRLPTQPLRSYFSVNIWSSCKIQPCPRRKRLLSPWRSTNTVEMLINILLIYLNATKGTDEVGVGSKTETL